MLMTCIRKCILLSFFSLSLSGTYAQHSLWTWGNNDYAALGDGYWTPADGGVSTSDPGVVTCYDDWIAISAGWDRSAGIRQDGTLWIWGTAAFMGVPLSQLEYPVPYLIQSVPLQIGTDHDWVWLTTSGDVTFARKADGSLWGLGNNNTGQVGVGTAVNVLGPTLLGAGWRDVVSYDVRSAGIRDDGTFWTWGKGGDVLGDAAAAGQNFATPQRVGTDNDWKSVFIGVSATLAQKNDGSLWAWGIISDGQLGDGTTTDRPAPVRIGMATDWSLFASGYELSFKETGKRFNGYVHIMK